MSFEVQNTEELASTLPNMLKDMKELLGEFGPQIKTELENLEITHVVEGNKVSILVDLGSHPLVNAYLDNFQEQLSLLKKVDAKFEATFCSDIDWSDFKEFNEEKLCSQKLQYSMKGSAFRIKNVL